MAQKRKTQAKKAAKKSPARAARKVAARKKPAARLLLNRESNPRTPSRVR